MSSSTKPKRPAPPPPDYTAWESSALVSRIKELETALAKANALLPPPPKAQRRQKPPGAFDASKHSTRLIAIKFAYLGQPYNGYEYHGNDTALPTVEETLYSALLKARLVAGTPGIDPESPLAWPGDDAANYSKCGRTDRGVSAFGQVVGVRVRSSKPLPKPASDTMEIDASVEGSEGEMVTEKKEWHHIDDELPYTSILNRLLPPTIRVLSWCPTPPADFSARFNCRARHYRYFFTTPALPRVPLDIPAMREAASYFLGAHDFRNFCKIDASKQINNFERTILHSSIELLPSGPGTSSAVSGVETYYFDLRGTAFLWHQVRHMMGILFLVGQGFEKPTIVRDMLDLEKFPTKPVYEMAEDRPLVLWDCQFEPGEIEWIPAKNETVRGVLEDTVWAEWHRARIDSVLAEGLLGIVEGLEKGVMSGGVHGSGSGELKKRMKPGHVLVSGGGDVKARGEYVPLVKRDRLREVEEINRMYLERKGDWRERRERRDAKRVKIEGEDGGEEIE